MNSPTLQSLTDQVVSFREERDWKQFHNPKDMVLSLMLEAAELGEHTQWKSNEQFLQQLDEHRSEIADELSDILYWVLLLSNDLEIDLADAFERKLEKNRKKYPIEKARGSATKYTELSEE